MLRAVLCFAVLASGCLCGGGSYELKPQRIDQTFEANNVVGGTCASDGKPLGTVRYDVAAFNDALGIDRNLGCLMPGARFGLEASVLETSQSRAAGETCSVPGGGAQGTVTLDAFEATYDWKNASGATQTEKYTLTCTGTKLDLGGEWDPMNAALNTCLARIDEAGHEFLRQGYNRRADVLNVTALGSCSATACFYVKLGLRLKLLSGSAALDGCP